MKTYLVTISTCLKINAPDKTNARLDAEEMVNILRNASRVRIVGIEELKFKVNPKDPDDPRHE